MAKKKILPTLLSSASIRDMIRVIDTGAKGIALITSEEGLLLGAVTDGDVRRAVLASVSLDAPVQTLLDHKAGTATERPITARAGTMPDVLLEIMREHGIRQLPLLDDQDRVVDLAVMEDLVHEMEAPVQAVIMAGGFGKRLRPLTDDTPKPMLLVGDRPLIEHVVERLRNAGIRNVNISTFYLPEKIVDHFGDGAAFGVDMHYVQEDRPLGTAGALSLLINPDEPVLVTNGDILTAINYRSMWDFHREHEATLTVAVRKYQFQVPYGVVTLANTNVTELTEKPTIDFFVNAGIYLLEPYALRQIPKEFLNGAQFHMTDLIQRLLDQNRKVISFPIHEYWLDIGQMDDYQQAQDDVLQGRIVMRAA